MHIFAHLIREPLCGERTRRALFCTKLSPFLARLAGDKLAAQTCQRALQLSPHTPEKVVLDLAGGPYKHAYGHVRANWAVKVLAVAAVWAPNPLTFHAHFRNFLLRRWSATSVWPSAAFFDALWTTKIVWKAKRECSYPSGTNNRVLILSMAAYLLMQMSVNLEYDAATRMQAANKLQSAFSPEAVRGKALEAVLYVTGQHAATDTCYKDDPKLALLLQTYPEHLVSRQVYAVICGPCNVRH